MDHSIVPAENLQLQRLPMDTEMINRYVSSLLQIHQPRPQSHKSIQLANVARMEHRAIQISDEDLRNFAPNVQAQYIKELEQENQELSERVNVYSYEFWRQIGEMHCYYENHARELVAAKERELRQHFERKLIEQRKADRQLHYSQQSNTYQQTLEMFQDEMNKITHYYQLQNSKLQRAREEDYSQYSAHLTEVRQQLDIKDQNMKDQSMLYQMNLQDLQKQKNSLYHEYATNCTHQKVLIAMNAKRIIPRTPEEERLVKETAEEVQEILDNNASKDAEIARLNAELLDLQDAQCKHPNVDDMKTQLETAYTNGKTREQLEMSNRHLHNMEEQLNIKDRELKSFQAVLKIKDGQFADLNNEKEQLRKELEEKKLQLQNMSARSTDAPITAPPSDSGGGAWRWDGGYVESSEWASLFTESSLWI